MRPTLGHFRLGVLGVILLGTAGGCAEGPALHRISPMSVGSFEEGTPASSTIAVASPQVETPILVPIVKAADTRNDRPHASAVEPAYVEPIDPFASPQDEVEEYDPWEPFNATMFEVNRTIDRYALKPIAQAYNFVLPDAAQRGVQNFFHNLRTGPRLFNNLLQGKVVAAGTELGRFVLNSTVGLAGFIDIAKDLQLDTPDEDFGQTLGSYGMPPGPYLVLPLFPPFTLRDATGYVVDLALDPINWLVFPLVEVNNVPSVIAHKNRTTTSIVQLGGRSVFLINERSLNLESFEGVEEATVDLYSAVRNAYLQQRAKAIRE